MYIAFKTFHYSKKTFSQQESDLKLSDFVVPIVCLCVSMLLTFYSQVVNIVCLYVLGRSDGRIVPL